MPGLSGMVWSCDYNDNVNFLSLIAETLVRTWLIFNGTDENSAYENTSYFKGMLLRLLKSFKTKLGKYIDIKYFSLTV